MPVRPDVSITAAVLAAALGSAVSLTAQIPVPRPVAPQVAPIATAQPSTTPTAAPRSTLTISMGTAAQPATINLMSWSWGASQGATVASPPASRAMGSTAVAGNPVVAPSQTTAPKLMVVTSADAARALAELQQSAQMGRAAEITLTSVGADGRSQSCVVHGALLSQLRPVLSGTNAVLAYQATFVGKSSACN